ncbi:DUF4157 domain-containing protein [Krasilnikovia sp. M28-CT-15]|uniref:eCIS core domain-containing protein n=1 Tax=Krasilnikovia sp. M28-CT-15 TaxID=3373540 RepID=UPI00387623CF
MASAPASERRPRTLRRVVRRLFTDRWAGRRGRRGLDPAAGPAVAADLAAALPVRASWPVLRWWRQWRSRHTDSSPGPTGRGIVTAPAMLRDSPARSRAVTGRGLSGARARLGAVRPPLVSGPATGPDVRPGHEPVLRPALVLRDRRGDARPGDGRRRPGDAGVVRSGGDHPHPWADAGDGAPYREGPLGVRPVLAWTGAGRSPGPAVSGPAGAGSGGGDTRAGGLLAGGDMASGAFGPGVGRGAGSSGGAVAGTGPGLVTGPELRTGRRLPGRAGSLTSRPGPGPSVRTPESAADLPVLGAGPLPPGTGPDPAGAVTTRRPSHGRGLLGGYGAPVPEKPVPEKPGSEKPGSEKPGADPRARWEAAVAARPLEAPRTLPGALHAMASALTGRARPPMYTTGPATRHALAAAGALGATTGTVVHLPEAPPNVPAMSEVLAHELTHTRNPVRRPRFLLEHVSGLLDDDERQALSAGRERLADVGQGLLGAGRQAGEGLVSAGRQRLAEAAPTAAGIVDQLPVGGGIGAVGDVATRAARAAVLEAASGPMAGLAGAAGGARDAAAGALDSAGGLAADAASGVTGAVDAAAGAVSGAASTVAGAASGAVGAATGALGAASGAVGAAKAALDPDKVVEIVEARLLREIERRGGRWAGVF